MDGGGCTEKRRIRLTVDPCYFRRTQRKFASAISTAMKRSCLFLSVLLMNAFSSAILHGAPADRLDTELETVRSKNDLPAMAGVVFTTAGLRAKGVCGVRKRGEAPKATDNDLWHIGSMTKMMTATLAGTFVAEKKLAWTDKVSRFFPELAGKIDPSLRDITLNDLLSHRSGLKPNLRWPDLAGKGSVREQRVAAVQELLCNPPEFEPGTFHYSNSGYVVVGAILESLGDKPWEELIAERIFRPLGMKSPGFGGTGTPGKLDQPWGHQEKSGQPVGANGPAVDNPPVMGPAGTLHMTLDDLTVFLTDQLRGAAGEKALLPTEIYQEIQSPHPADGEYGYGWFILQRSWAGGKTLNHNGSNTMNYAVCWLSVPKRFGAVVTCNQRSVIGCDEAVSALIQWFQR